MSIEIQVATEIKNAMLAREKVKLEAFRAIKNAFIQLKTSGKGITEISDEEAVKIIQKLVKQRVESAKIFKEQSRADLYEKENAEVEAMSIFIPKQMSEDEITTAVESIVKEMGATGMQDMGKVMGASSKKLAGKADNGIVSKIVKTILSK